MRSPEEFLAEADGIVAELRRRPEEADLLRYVEKIAADVRAGVLPPRERRRANSMSWILTDRWDLNDPLGHRILTLDRRYLSL
jgi:hypothetical protein